MEVKDEDEAIPLHDACAGGKVGHSFTILSPFVSHGMVTILWLMVLFFVEIGDCRILRNSRASF